MTARFGSRDLRSELSERLRYDLPAVAAPMFLVSGVDLVKAASQAGIIGAFPSLNARSPTELRAWLDDLSEWSDADRNAAVAVNLVTHRTNTRFQDDLTACVDHRVPLVITALGSPEPALALVHSYGGLVFADVNTPAMARKAAERGADGLVLVCAGAGGHTGILSPFAFVAAVRKFFDGPLIVAGGISTGAAIRAVGAMDGDLAYLGTRLLAASESMAVPDYKTMVVQSGFEDILCTDAITGALANKLRPSFQRVGIDPDSLESGKKFDLTSLGTSVSKWKDLWSAGHGVGSVLKSETTAEIIAQLRREYLGAS